MTSEKGTIAADAYAIAVGGASARLRKVVSHLDAVLGAEVDHCVLAGPDLDLEAPSRCAHVVVRHLVDAGGNLLESVVAVPIRTNVEAHPLGATVRRLGVEMDLEALERLEALALVPYDATVHAAVADPFIPDVAIVGARGRAGCATACAGQPFPRYTSLFRGRGRVSDDPIELGHRLVTEIEPGSADRKSIVQEQIAGTLLERHPVVGCRDTPFLSLERFVAFGGVIHLGRWRSRRR